MNQLIALRARLFLEVSQERSRLQKAWVGFPPMPVLEWEGSAFREERECACARNVALLREWRAAVRVWQAATGSHCLPEALEGLIGAL